MPDRLSKPCLHPGCGELVKIGKYCDKHKPPPRVYDDKRQSAARRGYGSKWRKYAHFFLAKHPYCNICGGLAQCVDHITPHKGDKQLFWDTENHQALCFSCHSRKTQTSDKFL